MRRRDGWVVDSGGLENRWGSHLRGFESLSLRKQITIPRGSGAFYYKKTPGGCPARTHEYLETDIFCFFWKVHFLSEKRIADRVKKFETIKWSRFPSLIYPLYLYEFWKQGPVAGLGRKVWINYLTFPTSRCSQSGRRRSDWIVLTVVIFLIVITNEYGYFRFIFSGRICHTIPHIRCFRTAAISINGTSSLVVYINQVHKKSLLYKAGLKTIILNCINVSAR